MKVVISQPNKLSYLQKVWLTLNWLEEQTDEYAQPVKLYTPLRSVSTATRNLSKIGLEKFMALEAHAIGQAADSGVKFIGATLHVVTEKMDDGAIVAQVVSPIRLNTSRDQLNKVSFLQKTYLILATLDCVHQNILQLTLPNLEVKWSKEANFSCSANPCIQSKDIKDIFNAYQKSVNIGEPIQ